MSTDDKLEGFKISDMKKAEVRSFKKTVPARAGSDAAAEAANTGFDNIEDRLENSSIEAVADEIRKTYEQLEEMATKGDMKTKAAAQKSMVAYERTADLFEYLFATKSSIQES